MSEFKFYYKGIVSVQKFIERRYRKSFKLYFSYLSACHLIVENGLKQIGTKAMTTTTTEAIGFGLLARLLRVADQVGILLLNGYADAALVIWRTFYEQAIVLMFLAYNNDEALSLRFRDHSVIYARKLAESYNKQLVTEGFRAVEEETFQNIEVDYERVMNEPGRLFVDKDYGWVSGVEGILGKPSFYVIEAYLGMQRYRPFYIWASTFTHGNFNVFKNFMEEERLFAGRIKDVNIDQEGLVDPMQITLSVLQKAVVPFLGVISDEAELELNIRLLDGLYGQLIRHFKREAKKAKESLKE
jgi:hypothetical protein